MGATALKGPVKKSHQPRSQLLEINMDFLVQNALVSHTQTASHNLVSPFMVANGDRAIMS